MSPLLHVGLKFIWMVPFNGWTEFLPNWDRLVNQYLLFRKWATFVYNIVSAVSIQIFNKTKQKKAFSVVKQRNYFPNSQRIATICNYMLQNSNIICR